MREPDFYRSFAHQQWGVGPRPQLVMLPKPVSPRRHLCPCFATGCRSVSTKWPLERLQSGSWIGREVEPGCALPAQSC